VPHTFYRVTGNAMKRNQYYVVYGVLTRRRQVAPFNQKIETQNEQPSLLLGDANHFGLQRVP
jgi:hypothetical protein